MAANTRFKDSVFSLLFSAPAALRELYGALQDLTLPSDVPISLNTLSDVLFMGQINDLSFTIDNRLVILIEHQSTINPNMPLRLLMYIARIYEKIIERKKLYQSKLEKIPTPEFIVLYNGEKPYPDRATLRLSDAFKEAGSLRGALSSGPELELEVKVYNINYGHNKEMLEKSETLRGYSILVEKIRGYEKGTGREGAIRQAIKECIEEGILGVFLERNGSEVMNMLITEWDTEEAKKVWFEEGQEVGWKKGHEEGREEGREEGWIELAVLLQEGKNLEEALASLKGHDGTAYHDV